MHKIRTADVVELMETGDIMINSLIDNLLDYSQYISSVDEKIKTLNLNTRYGLYMAEQFDMHRREKHDIAITSLQKLNDISVQRLGRIVYEGIIDSDHRSEIAQAIMLFGNEVLELI
jgi:hypothetical protein